jgi:PmbA protein
MTSKECLELARWAIVEARKCGAQDAAADVFDQRQIEVVYRNKAIEKLQEAKRHALSIATYLNNRYSSQSTNNLRKESLEKFIADAVAMTKYLGEDVFRRLPDPKYYEGREKKDLELRDPSYESLSTEGRIEWARQAAEAAAAGSARTVSVTAGFSDSLSRSIKVHSNGFEGEQEGTTFSLFASPTLKDDEGKLVEDYAYGVTRFRADLPDPRTIGREAAGRASQRVGQRKVRSEKMDMVVENRQAGQVLSPLAGPLSGAALQQKQSFLEGKLGRKIASGKLTVIDDPFLPRGLGSRLFDEEGLSAKRRTFIEKGVLKAYFIDNYYGRKLGMEPTTGGYSNVVFEGGSKSREEIQRNVKRGIFVTGFIGGNSNSTTGDFSFGVSGMLIENGVLVRPVYEMNISGNMKDFWNELFEIGNDPYPYSDARTPTLHFRNIQFSGV